MSRFVVSTMARELIFGSLNSGFSSSPTARLSGSTACSRFSKLELGRGVDGDASSTTATSVLDILDLGVLAQPCYRRRGPPSRLLIEFRTTNGGEFCQEALNSRGKSACGLTRLKGGTSIQEFSVHEGLDCSRRNISHRIRPQCVSFL